MAEKQRKCDYKILNNIFNKKVAPKNKVNVT